MAWLTLDEAFDVETDWDLANTILLEGARVAWGSCPSDKGSSGVPGGVRSLVRSVTRDQDDQLSESRMNCKPLK